MRIGLFIGEYENNFRIVKFLYEFFLENCFIHSFFNADEIYEIPQKLDVLFLDTNAVSEDDFSKIENVTSCPVVLLDNRLKTRSNNHFTIPLLFNSFNYIKVLTEITEKFQDIEKLIHFKDKNEKILIPLSSIIYIYACDKKINLYLSNGTAFKASEGLKSIYERLADKRFLYVHSEYIVNMEHVKIMREDSFSMTDNAVVPLRNYKRKDIVNEFYKYKLALHKKITL